YAGLRKIETQDDDGQVQDPHRPQHVLHFMQSVPFEPTFVVDVSNEWEKRMEALLAFRSQFHQPKLQQKPDDEPQTFVSNPDFLEWVTAQARVYGHRIGARY